ncbi:hypothetical protein NUM_42900 [Actinocatenispora comari]|uniref:Uncharacterized protein n=1 Tax=Actinocatenispora comari TaxID=2807577 RepID=A0A8J4ACE2_9ACTN|nr:hypothetical protein NUM_42900 [Actinocatenispora comari]
MLVVVHTLVSGFRLLDVVDDIESDPRIQVVFTVAPDAFAHGVASMLRELGALVLPWHQAVRERFDLAIAASRGALHELHAPVLLLPHGAGFGKTVRPGPGADPTSQSLQVYGLDAQRLLHNGRVIPAVLALPHQRQLELLEHQCPPAVPVARVVGDPCFDRLVASLPHRSHYRQMCGVAPRQRLVVVSSTWGCDGVFGHHPNLLPQLMTALAASRFQVVALLHPAVWTAHGHRQVLAWLRDCREAGLMVLDPAEDWRGLIVAADVVIGDHGSVPVYAAAIGRPVLHLAPATAGATAAGSAQALLAERADTLRDDRPLLGQILAARPVDADTLAAALTSRPGQAGVLIDREIYRLLSLPALGQHRRPRPVPTPSFSGERAA